MVNRRDAVLLGCSRCRDEGRAPRSIPVFRRRYVLARIVKRRARFFKPRTSTDGIALSLSYFVYFFCFLFPSFPLQPDGIDSRVFVRVRGSRLAETIAHRRRVIETGKARIRSPPSPGDPCSTYPRPHFIHLGRRAAVAGRLASCVADTD